MKWTLYAVAAGMTQMLPAQPIRLILESGALDRTHALVSFQAPASWEGEHTVVANEGTLAASLQVDAEGHAVMLVPKLEKNAALTFSAAPHNPPTRPYGLTLEKTGSRLNAVLHRDGKPKPVFSYQMEPGEVPDGVPEVYRHGAHLHPLYSPGGLLLTNDHPADHRWHRGIWMAWTHTKFEGRTPDFWNMGKPLEKGAASGPLTAEVRFESLEKTWNGPVQAGFISKHRFVDHLCGSAKDVLTETWEVTISSIDGDRPMHVLDLTSTQRCAGSSPLKLPKYHYGGLGVRGNALWDAVDKVRMLTSNGDDRTKGDSTQAKWVHLGGDVDGKATGMVILVHPDNFRFPQPLRLNPKNPQLCVAPSQLGDWSIKPGSEYISRYRIILADGQASVDWIEPLWADYAEPVKVKLE